MSIKDASNWEEKDLVGLIQLHAEESLTLEFKRAEALGETDKSKTEISKDVSSFANSAGGLIIYGLEEDSKSPHKATAISPVKPQSFSKEWLDQIINSRIHPRIQGLLIHPINLTGQNSGQCAYAVIIPKSPTAHQAHDKRYYKRFNSQSAPMEDYEIRQTMNRAEKPTYEVAIRSKPQTVNGNNAFKFVGHIINTSELVGHEVSSLLLIPEDLAKVQGGPFKALQSKGIAYIRVPADKHLTLHPQERADIGFPGNFVVVPNLLPSLCFPVILRIYDIFGIALEVECEVIFHNGTITVVSIISRQETY